MKGEKFQGIKRFAEPQIAGQLDVEIGDMILSTIKSRPDLDAQFKDVLSGVELDAFRIECLRPVSRHSLNSETSKAPPFYEIYGENLVAAGRYEQVIRYRDHLLPIRDALCEHIKRSV